MKLYVASHNSDKVREIKDILQGLDIEIFSAADVEGSFAPEETGKSLEENALLKARALFKLVGEPVLADDTGLEVDALNGRPGIRSSRYAGENASYDENVKRLLEELEDIEEIHRSARFRTVAVLIMGAGIEITTEGRCDGTILRERRGEGGFGYDPVFLIPEIGKTFSEMELAEKSALSHRGRAFAGIRDLLTKFLSGEMETS
ncbi:MAG: RdgB/HAM1 family non-canonical purine NTP pyrophosphatase [Candidatus Eisenbacteria bacterium]|uniref:dITP/XTP pyrophosphatase n=1 Tax=Eiseniibacteriota bacterium TaxID=2212470 RepID=A0A948RVI2_UNCEI|nr:RdgB/HAM1 family non-canonical purine NTP pyrophosphatase [Candidatus Eisenbacteria bacterium]MBU1951173.1 RdgB/HAM1 family non-canonical purine NTP pyrophosphatase [Candidatus Eisenbacteria bacterium]MBU2691788.1 RdgB/HAM1 family non-canonical purine NTP pyrophosphatase [Candidatus Eisenbacteria bacterium]